MHAASPGFLAGFLDGGSRLDRCRRSGRGFGVERRDAARRGWRGVVARLGLGGWTALAPARLLGWAVTFIAVMLGWVHSVKRVLAGMTEA